jgi:hypothetical protein
MAAAKHRALAEQPMPARPTGDPAKSDVLEWNASPAAPPGVERSAATTEAVSTSHAAATTGQDQLAKVKLGGREIFHRVTQGLKNERGVHIESLLACLGALAGYACQACVRENNVRTGATSPESGLTVAIGADGRRYFFGDALNRPLAEDRYSVWSVIAGAVQQLGKPLPDIEGIFQHVASTVGGAEFGVPRIPEAHRAGDLPINYLKAIWPQLLPIAQRFATEPAHLPMIYGLAIQHAIFAARNIIDPTLAGIIAMECAVPMSKVDLG